MKNTKNINVKSFLKTASVTGLAALTALTSLGMGSVNVLADEAKLPTYIFNGTNAERAISDYFVNGQTTTGSDTVVIPHMDILNTKDNGSTFDVYGNFYVMEYGKENNALVARQAAPESAGRFTLKKNSDGTFTVDSYTSVPTDADKDDFKEIFGKDLCDEAYDVYKEDINSELWNVIRAEDIGYYSYDNSLGLDKIVTDGNHSIDVANVSFSAKSPRTMYVQEGANVRSAGTKKAAAFDGLGKGEDIVVTGMANGWGRITMNGRTGYIASSLLGDSKPAKQEKKAEKKEDKKQNKVSVYDTTGLIEYYDGNKVIINGVKANVTENTSLAGDLSEGNLAELEWKEYADGYCEAILLHTEVGRYERDNEEIDDETIYNGTEDSGNVEQVEGDDYDAANVEQVEGDDYDAANVEQVEGDDYDGVNVEA